jgi:nucleoside-diphosphate-sugar epimerase
VKALVIGSAGNVGRPLCAFLRFLGDEVLELDQKQGWRSDYLVGDINQPIDLLDAFDQKPDVVYLLAGMVSRVTCEQAPGIAIQTNVAGVNNVLQLCKRSGAKLVYFSTSEVYGPDYNPMDERLSDPRPNNRYGLSKLLGERLVEYEVEHHGLRAVTLRPFMIYAEGEETGDHRSAMIRFAWNLQRLKSIEVHRGSRRGWLHVSDAVTAIEKAAHLDEYAVINIGHPDVRSMWEVAELIRVELDAARDLVTETRIPERMTLVKNPSLARQRDLLGFEPEVTLEAGARRVCDWVRTK